MSCLCVCVCVCVCVCILVCGRWQWLQPPPRFLLQPLYHVQRPQHPPPAQCLRAVPAAVRAELCAVHAARYAAPLTAGRAP